MGRLIDLCGTPIDVEQIKHFRLVKREYLFYPAYQETEEQVFSLFARMGAANKKKFKFVKMVPFGALLNDKEKPSSGGYEIKDFGEFVAANALVDVGKAIGSIANIAADMLRVDTSGNKEFRILTQGRRIVDIKLRDIPAKVSFISGKISDVYKNDPIYEFLGEPIAPTIAAVPTLVVNVEKVTYVFFGGGIDLDDAEAVYHSLLDAYNQLQENKKKEKTRFVPKLSMPKFKGIPTLRIQTPSASVKEKQVESAKEYIAETRFEEER